MTKTEFCGQKGEKNIILMWQLFLIKLNNII